MKLRRSNSIVTAEGPRCSLRSRKVYSTARWEGSTWAGGARSCAVSAGSLAPTSARLPSGLLADAGYLYVTVLPARLPPACRSVDYLKLVAINVPAALVVRVVRGPRLAALGCVSSLPSTLSQRPR